MLKPQQLRQTLTDSVPKLQLTPDALNFFIDCGRIVSTLASSLSFEYQYRLYMVITDYTGNIDLLIVPLLAWQRTNEPDIMATEEKRRTGFTFQADVISDTASDISIELQLSERVIVKQADDGLHVTYVGENPLPENDARPVQLYVKGELMSELQLVNDRLEALISSLSAPARKEMAGSIGRKLRASQQQNIKRQQAPDGKPFKARKTQPVRS